MKQTIRTKQEVINKFAKHCKEIIVNDTFGPIKFFGAPNGKLTIHNVSNTDNIDKALDRAENMMEKMIRSIPAVQGYESLEFDHTIITWSGDLRPAELCEMIKEALYIAVGRQYGETKHDWWD